MRNVTVVWKSLTTILLNISTLIIIEWCCRIQYSGLNNQIDFDKCHYLKI